MLKVSLLHCVWISRLEIRAKQVVYEMFQSFEKAAYLSVLRLDNKKNMWNLSLTAWYKKVSYHWYNKSRSYQVCSSQVPWAPPHSFPSRSQRATRISSKKQLILISRFYITTYIQYTQSKIVAIIIMNSNYLAQFSLKNFHHAMRVSMIMYGWPVTFPPAQHHEVESAVSFINQVPCISAHKV